MNDTLILVDPTKKIPDRKLTWDEMYERINKSGKVSIRPMRKSLPPMKKD